jgi:uncharacterized protein (DUF362 family)
MGKATVAVVRKIDQENLRDTILRAVDMIGGFSRFVKRGNTVLVKPNLIGGEPVPGTMTDPTVVKAVCDLASEAGASRIIVGDSCHVGGNTTDYAKSMGFLDALKGTPYEFVDFKKVRMKTIEIKGTVIDTLKIPEMLDEIDVIINVPVMKVHMHVKVTLATKNIKGLLHDSSKRKMHEAGIENALVDLARTLRGDLNIIDGIVGSEGRAPSWGIPKPMGLILAGADPIALDVVCSEIMGLDSKEIIYLQKAGEEGIGVADLSRIEVLGEKIEEVRSPFTPPPTGLLDQVDSVCVYDKDACSGCMAWLSAAISQFYSQFLELDEILKKHDEKFFIALGTNIKPEDVPDEIRDKTIFYGKCAMNQFKDYGCGEFVKGCPPAMLQDLTTAVQRLYEKRFRSGKKIFTTMADLPVSEDG